MSTNHTSTQWCGLSAKSECGSDMCCTPHAARWKYRTQKWRKNRHLRTIAQLCRAVPSQLRHISTVAKKLLNSNISTICPHNMVNVGLLTAKIGWWVLGTAANFNGFAVSQNLACYNFDIHEWILTFFGRNVTDKVAIKRRFTMSPQITCASALPGKTGKHENHTFHSIGLCYTHNAPVCCLPGRKNVICDVFDSV